MSEELNKFLLGRILNNEKIIKPFVWISLTIGVNLTRITGYRDPIKLINVFWFLLSIIGLYGQYYFIWEHRTEPLVVFTDALCTTFQTWISFSKLVHFFRKQHKFQQLLHTAKTAEILQDFEILKLNILNKKQLINEIEEIVNDSWLDVKRQLNILIVSVFGITLWYYFSCLTYNIYYTYVKPEEFYVLFPFQSSYPMWRDKGIQFPYYFFLYLTSGACLHTSAFGAVCFAGFFIVTSIHALALVKILIKLLSYTTSENILPRDRIKFMLACCRFHQRIYYYCEAINNLYFIQSAALFLITTIIMCMLMFQASEGLGTDFKLVVQMFLYFCASGFEVSTFCVNGQRLTTESEYIPVAFYDVKWYDECSEFKFIIHMMLMRTNRTIILQVGGFTTMSFVTLLAIMRSGCSFSLMLREVNKE